MKQNWNHTVYSQNKIGLDIHPGHQGFFLALAFGSPHHSPRKKFQSLVYIMSNADSRSAEYILFVVHHSNTGNT